MKRNLLKFATFCLASSLVLTSCDKDKDNDVDINTLKSEVLENTAKNVIEFSYSEMLSKVNALKTSVADLVASPTDAKLTTARNNWKEVRAVWEKTEAWLFGAVATEDIDPRIDTWPVDFNEIDQLLASSTVLDAAYFTRLDQALESSDEDIVDAANAMRGFHPIEYILWGEDGTKTAAKLATETRAKQYLVALTDNLQTLTKEVYESWSNGYSNQVAKAGNGSTEFATQKGAFVEIVEAMAGICGEVGDGKMGEPFNNQDPALEESPFSKNSLADFTNNIEGIMNIYQGKFGSRDGKGLEDFVQYYNKSLDLEIKAKHTAAINALKAITNPFGTALLASNSQSTLVQNAINRINELAEVLNDGTDGNGKDLKDFILQYSN